MIICKCWPVGMYTPAIGNTARDRVMKLLVTAAIIALGVSNGAWALCKYRAPDGTWTYANSCREKPAKEIDESAALVLQRNQEQRKRDEGVQGQRLRGYEYSEGGRGGMQIRLAEPDKRPTGNEVTSR